MSGSAPPTPPSNAGTTIANDITLINSLVSPIISAFGPQGAAIGSMVSMAMVLLAKIEPDVYNAVTALVSGQALTPQQETDKQNAIDRLQTPDQYFA